VLNCVRSAVCLSVKRQELKLSSKSMAVVPSVLCRVYFSRGVSDTVSTDLESCKIDLVRESWGISLLVSENFVYHACFSVDAL